LSSGKVVQRCAQCSPGAHHGFFASAGVPDGGALGAKLVRSYPQNVGIHTHHAVIVLFQGETGDPLAVMDGRLITEMRTRRLGVANPRLARAGGTLGLAILDPGPGEDHLQRCAGPILHELRVWDPRCHRRRNSIGEAVASAADAVGGADVVVVATSATTPSCRGWLSPGRMSMRSARRAPTGRELTTIRHHSRIFVDSREAALRESGDVIAARGEITQRSGGVPVVPGRRDPKEITLFKSVGVAVEDVQRRRCPDTKRDDDPARTVRRSL